MPSGIMNYGIVQDSTGNIWSVTEHEGPICYNPSREKLESLDKSLLTASQLRTHDIAYSSNNEIYVSSVDGLMLINDNKAIPVDNDSYLEKTPALRNQRDIWVEEQGTLLIASSGGFLRFDPARDGCSAARQADPVRAPPGHHRVHRRDRSRDRRAPAG